MSTTTDALSVAAEAENAAVFTYGVITAFVSSARRAMLEDFIAEHRVARDALNTAISTAGATAPEPDPGYTLPIKVADPVSAAKVVLAAEVDCTTAYRALLEKADSTSARTLGADGLTASASRAAQWRVVLGQRPVTVALPGGAK